MAVTGSGGADGWWSVVAAAAWSHLDETGEAADLDGLSPPEDGDPGKVACGHDRAGAREVPPVRGGRRGYEAPECPRGPRRSPVTTGVASVDQVLGELDGLDELPLDEHIGAFERAHESLRSALDAPPDSAPDDLA